MLVGGFIHLLDEKCSLLFLMRHGCFYHLPMTEVHVQCVIAFDAWLIIEFS